MVWLLAGADVFSAMTIFSTIVLYLSGWPTIQNILKNSNSQGFTVVPFIACFVSLWLKYGMLSEDSTMIFVNLVGAIIEGIYVIIFYINTKQKESIHRIIIGLLVFMFSVLLYVKLFVKDPDKALHHQGLVCAGFNIINYGAPLTAAAAVIRTKSTKNMSLVMSFVYCIVAVEWFIYGQVHSDNFIMVPNFCGIVLGILQLSLFVLYPSSRSRVLSKIGSL